jgi:BirA family transcriptional regulator, biotin operon repressor / biotin---[acetyl-CoA-carboxylase] ligase
MTSGQYPICPPLTEIPDSLMKAGREAFDGFSLRVIASTPSTQDVVKRAVLAGSRPGFCCVALEQTQGRGRQGRSWFGRPGQSLLVSIAVVPPAGAAQALPFIAALALHDTVTGFGAGADIKWPNDILIGGRKLAGTLIEGVAAREPAAVGIGLNLDIETFPPGVPAGASLSQAAGRRICWQEALESLLPHLRARLDQTATAGLQATLKAWSERSSSIGTEVRAVSNGQTITGRAIGVDDGGALLVETDKGVARLLAADVHIGTEP